MKIVGVNIRKAREEKGLTLRELAKKMEVSASLLSQIETGKASPSLATLRNIAASLDTTIGNLVGEKQVNLTDPVMKKEQRKSLKSIGQGIKMYLLSSPDPTKNMEPLLFQLDVNGSTGNSMYKHFGQEFVLVLKGALEIRLNDLRYILKKGDSIYFNSSTPHSFKNAYNGVTEALWVDTPPTF